MKDLLSITGLHQSGVLQALSMEAGAVGGRRVEAVVMGAVGGIAAILDLLVAGVQFEKSDEQSANCNSQLELSLL